MNDLTLSRRQFAGALALAALLPVPAFAVTDAAASLAWRSSASSSPQSPRTCRNRYSRGEVFNASNNDKAPGVATTFPSGNSGRLSGVCFGHAAA